MLHWSPVVISMHQSALSCAWGLGLHPVTSGLWEWTLCHPLLCCEPDSKTWSIMQKKQTSAGQHNNCSFATVRFHSLRIWLAKSTFQNSFMDSPRFPSPDTFCNYLLNQIVKKQSFSSPETFIGLFIAVLQWFCCCEILKLKIQKEISSDKFSLRL